MAYQQNIFIDKDTNFELDVEVLDENSNNFNFSGYSSFSQIRKSWNEDVTAEFTITLTSGNINLKLAPSDTANASPGKYMYDVCIKHSTTNAITKVMEGTIFINPTISRE